MVKYFFAPHALREIKKLPRPVQRRILNKLDYFCKSNPLKFADFLIDSRLGNYRFRVGDYRVIFDKTATDSILILKVGHRREIYRRGWTTTASAAAFCRRVTSSEDPLSHKATEGHSKRDESKVGLRKRVTSDESGLDPHHSRLVAVVGRILGEGG